MNKATIFVGDNRQRLLQLDEKSVQTVVTSPPYWGLRDYGTAEWLGGDADCEHRPKVKPRSERPSNGLGGFAGEYMDAKEPMFKDHCKLCGAVREDQQLGLEATPDEFVENLCLVFDEIWRVLADDGTLWVNLGDSYSSVHTSGQRSENSMFKDTNYGDAQAIRQNKATPSSYGLKNKELVGVPWRFAFAMQKRGWYLRQDIIWAKPNPMPESVTDRCTKSHEYIFLFTKQPKYFYDHEAVKEPAQHDVGNANIKFGGTKYGDSEDEKHQTKSGNKYEQDGTRNKRDVWTVATKPYKEAHFATYPPALILPCVLAGTSEKGNCAACGLSYVRVTERPEAPQVEASDLDRFGNGEAGVHRKVGQAYQNWLNENPVKTTGWQKQCECDTDEVRPAVVLDPFSGSGTTGEVALTNGRDYIGLELNPDYAALSEKRISEAVGMFGDVDVQNG